MVPDYFEFQSSGKALFGRGLVDSAGTEVGKLVITRAFLVTDDVLARNGLAARVEAGLARSLDVVGRFSAVPPNSEVGAVRALAEAARAAGADGLVAVGGGSVIDTAKAANMMLSEGGDILDFQGVNLLERPLRTLVAIPTTAGTGSEVTNFAVVKDHDNQTKIHFASPYLVPHMAILDPEMTASMPPKLTAVTGFDALTHAIEAFVAQNAEPITDALALHAIRLINAHLPRAVSTGNDLGAREQMLLASTIAGIAFNNAGVGVVHAIAHVLGGIHDVPHGLANALMLPAGMAFNIPVATGRFAEIGRALGVAPGSDEEMASRAVDAVKQLRRAVGLPEKLSAVGVPGDDASLARIGSEAILDGAIFFNPREATEEELVGLVRESL